MEYEHGGDIYTYKGMMDFSVNVNPFGPSEQVIRAVRDSASLAGNYPDSSCRSLRQKLAEKKALPRDFFIAGNGAADLLLFANGAPELLRFANNALTAGFIRVPDISLFHSSAPTS